MHAEHCSNHWSLQSHEAWLVIDSWLSVVLRAGPETSRISLSWKHLRRHSQAPYQTIESEILEVRSGICVSISPLGDVEALLQQTQCQVHVPAGLFRTKRETTWLNLHDVHLMSLSPASQRVRSQWHEYMSVVCAFTTLPSQHKMGPCNSLTFLPARSGICVPWLKSGWVVTVWPTEHGKVSCGFQGWVRRSHTTLPDSPATHWDTPSWSQSPPCKKKPHREGTDSAALSRWRQTLSNGGKSSHCACVLFPDHSIHIPKMIECCFPSSS